STATRSAIGSRSSASGTRGTLLLVLDGHAAAVLAAVLALALRAAAGHRVGMGPARVEVGDLRRAFVEAEGLEARALGVVASETGLLVDLDDDLALGHLVELVGLRRVRLRHRRHPRPHVLLARAVARLALDPGLGIESLLDQVRRDPEGGLVALQALVALL